MALVPSGDGGWVDDGTLEQGLVAPNINNSIWKQLTQRDFDTGRNQYFSAATDQQLKDALNAAAKDYYNDPVQRIIQGWDKLNYAEQLYKAAPFLQKAGVAVDPTALANLQKDAEFTHQNTLAEGRRFAEQHKDSDIMGGMLPLLALGVIGGGALGLLGGGSGGAGMTGLAAGDTAGGGFMSGLSDFFSSPISSISNLFSGGSSGTGFGLDSLLGADGSLNLNALAAQDLADFGVSGVNALGNSLGSSYLDYLNPMLSDSQISGMLTGNPSLAQTVQNYITQNPGSTAKTALSALTGGGSNSLLGAGLGALLGGVNGSKQAGVTTTVTEPWAGQQPYLLDAFSKAKAAANGTPLTTQATSNYNAMLSGPTTNPMLGQDNPYLKGVIDNANADVTRAMMPAMNQANRASGSFGNSGVADMFSKNMTDAFSKNATNLRFQDYTNQQNLYENAVNRTANATNNANTFNAQPAQLYAQTVQGNYGGSQSTPYYTNPYSSMLGGAVAGSKLFGSLL